MMGIGHINPRTSRRLIMKRHLHRPPDAGGALILAELPRRGRFLSNALRAKIDANDLVVDGGRRIQRFLHRIDERRFAPDLQFRNRSPHIAVEA